MSAQSLLSQVWFGVLCCIAIGCVLGFVCRQRMVLALLISIPASIGLMTIGAWYVGDFPNQFSFQQPAVTTFWLGPPYLLLFFLPTSGAALLVTIIWRLRTKRVA
jgi:hypothetical protein